MLLMSCSMGHVEFCCAGASAGATPGTPSRFANAAARDAAFKKAKEAGRPSAQTTLGPQTGVMAMRMEGGGVTQGTAPGVETATTTGDTMHNEQHSQTVPPTQEHPNNMKTAHSSTCISLQGWHVQEGAGFCVLQRVAGVLQCHATGSCNWACILGILVTVCVTQYATQHSLPDASFIVCALRETCMTTVWIHTQCFGFTILWLHVTMRSILSILWSCLSLMT